MGLSTQRRLPAGASRSIPAGIPAGILAECWCHLVRAGEAAGIFLRAALLAAGCREEPGAWPWCVTPGRALPLLPALGPQGRREQPQTRAPGTAGQAARPGHLCLFTASTTAKECLSTAGICYQASFWPMWLFCGFVSRGEAEGTGPWNAGSHRAVPGVKSPTPRSQRRGLRDVKS